MLQPLQRLHDHHGTGGEDQQRVEQGGELGATAIAIGEGVGAGAGAEPFGHPAQDQSRHIAEVVQSIPHQGERTGGQADHQLQTRKQAVEQHAPAKGRRRGRAMLMHQVMAMGRPGPMGVMRIAWLDHQRVRRDRNPPHW
jgi:hypothetical protein